VVEPIEDEPLIAKADAASRSERPQCPHLFDPCHPRNATQRPYYLSRSGPHPNERSNAPPARLLRPREARVKASQAFLARGYPRQKTDATVRT
jgi:hypothetical protein